jgi:uracil-DNA glycosylase
VPGIGKKFKMDSYAGAEIWDRINKLCYIPCYHPSYLMQYGKDKTDKTIEIFKKAKRLAYGEE